MIIAPISAIPSWEGFEYQRHIALYMTLNQMCYEIEADNEYDISLYKLGIEGEEDFSIIKGDKYLSLHQVKEGAVNLNDSDKACFILSKLQYGADEAFFHVNTSIVIANDFVSKTLEYIDKLLLTFGKEVITKEEFSKKIKKLEESEEIKLNKKDLRYKLEEDKYILISKISFNTPKGSAYKILDHACTCNKERDDVVNVVDDTCNKERDDVVNAVDDIVKELNLYKDELNGKTDSNLWKVYSSKFDKPKDVILESCKLIDRILKKLHPEGEIYYDEEYFQFVYDAIVILSQNVISEHNTKSKKNACKIGFGDILEVIKKDHKAESNTTDYMYYVLLKLIKETFAKYPTSMRTKCSEDNCDNCETIDECNLYQQMQEIINNRSYGEKKDFLYKLLLRTPKNNLPRDAVVNNLFIALLKNIDGLKYYDSNVILAKKNDLIYRLTLDENEYIEDFELQLKNELGLNDADKLLIYESDVLITDRLNEDDYTYNQIKFNAMGSNELSEMKDLTSDSIDSQKKNYNKSKVIKLISKDVAEKELIDNE
ncbi:hypothetical protein EZV73_10160 [Acidaminobacter sp. JC074]|uniref:ABC-three component system protein n=1 Tax=Acidaminobacter sp. JC074 TaxID=2530199 RepID=UPI001F0D7324|nr:ABC-three component system protein [Acidaminobacter sp. JC074]MCH4887938.1 hypothetical protein [Acidaminobacter sp. JC074]